MVPLHCSQGQTDLQKAWSEVCLLSMGLAKYDLHTQVHTRHGQPIAFQGQSIQRRNLESLICLLVALVAVILL